MRKYGWLKRRRGGASVSIPLPLQGNVIFQHNIYDGNTSAQVGSYTYSRTGSTFYASSKTGLSSASANTLPMPAYRFNQTENGYGLQIESSTTNTLLYSQDFSNAVWATSGSASTTSNTQTAPDGTSTADTITGTNSTDYVSQASSSAAASKIGVFSIYLKAASTTTATIYIGDDSISENGTTICRLTTSWERYEVAKIFSASATGNIAVRILPGDQSIYVWGAQLEYRTVNNHNDKHANAYVLTTSDTATSGTGLYTIPNSVIRPADTKGSIAFWVNANWDPSAIGLNGSSALYTLSTNEDNFALRFGKLTPYVFINNTPYIGNSLGTTQMTHGPHEWQHYCVTWDVDDNVIVLYINGVARASSSSALSDVAFEDDDLYIGSYRGLGPYGADAMFSQIVMWSTELTAAEVLEVYNTKASQYTYTLGTGKLFEVELGTSPVPTLAGNYQYWYQRRGPAYKYDATNSIALAPDGEYLGNAYALGGYNKSGAQFQEYHQNILYYSEAPSEGAYWTTILSPTVTDNVEDFGKLAMSNIDGVENSGIQQDTAISAASDRFVFSVFAKVDSGTQDFEMTIEDTAGGESYTDVFTATDTIQRFVTKHDITAFSGSAANVRVRLLKHGVKKLYIGGMQLESKRLTVLHTNQYYDASTYIKTTGEIDQITFPDQLGYLGHRNFNEKKGTIIAWINAFVDNSTDYGPAQGPTIWGAPGQPGDRWMTVTGSLYPTDNPTVSVWWYDLRHISSYAKTPKNTWVQYAYGWETVGGTTTIKAWLNGSLVINTANSSTPSPRRMMFIGADANTASTVMYSVPLDKWLGLIDKLSIYGRLMDTSEVLTEYNNDKAAYGL